MCVRVGVHACVLGWAFMYVLGGYSCMCVRVGVHACVLGCVFMCVRVGVR